MKKKVEPFIIGIFLLLLMVIPVFVKAQYWMQVLIIGEIKTLLVMSLFVLCGITGQISLGQAGFFAIGAYTSALFSIIFSLSPWLTILIGALFAAIAGVIIGYPALRLKGPYLIIATVGFGEIIRLIALNWVSVTKGPMGLTNVPPLTAIKIANIINIDFNNKLANYYLLILIIAVITFLVYNLTNSRTGYALKSIRDDEIAAEVMGINLAYYKVMAFTFSALLAGLAGGFYVHYIRFVSPDSFTLSESINYLILLLVGGSSSILGPFIGGLGLTSLLESLRFLSEYRMITYSMILYFTILFLPKGLSNLLHKSSPLSSKKNKIRGSICS
ncbi:branched-chain amino acid ABC transporter permease [Thermoanaerobacteraceae bacterium SP2]|nr:branched-chain amino acid ABC transporter permease [Thermoanaerobacteraceae bacterium SP2]